MKKIEDRFEGKVAPWLMETFGHEIMMDRTERNHRFLEEALELVQACGCTQSEAHQLVGYVFSRPVGDPEQECGGVMVTLAALCIAQGLVMEECAEKELARVWTKVEQIRAKQAAKPKHSPLPIAGESREFPDELIRKLLLMSFAARLDDRDDEADAMKEAAETIGRLANGQPANADAMHALALEYLADTEAARTLFIECHAVWSKPESGGEPEPKLETLDDEDREHLAVLDGKIARARALAGGSDAAGN